MALTKDIFQVKADCLAQQTDLLQKICKAALYPEELLKLVEVESNKLGAASKELYIQGKEAGII